MTKRKQYIIDRKFQFRTTFTVIGIVAVITAFIIGAIATSVVYNNTKIRNIYEIEDNIVHFLASRTLGVEDQSFENAIDDVTMNHTRNMKTLNMIIKYNNILLIVLLVIIITEGIVLYILLIRKTHKISGPIYVMTNYMKQILDGEKPSFRPLRKDDEMKEFYSLLQETIDKLMK